jgi:hypothetical protein
MAWKFKFSPRLTVAQFERSFPTDDACRQYLADRRWPDGVVCPRCGNRKVYSVTNRPFHWQCTRCASKGGYRFSVLVGSKFENTNVGLKTWFKIIHLVLTSKDGISTLQIQRVMALGSYSTAQNVCRRVRAALVNPEFRKLMAIVGVDKSLVRGKAHNRRWGEQGRKGAGKAAGKDPVIGVAKRKSRRA